MHIKNKIREIIRVNHAGEMGAKVIYDGQILAMKLKRDKQSLALIEHMKKQEDIHFDYFDRKIIEQKVRPTVMQPIWKFGGFMLGFTSAMIDKKAAMACTTAVEEVIDEHYQRQIEFLDKANNQDLLIVDVKKNINKFRDEELEHRDLGYEHQAKDFIAFKGFSCFVKAITKTAIYISKKI